MNIAIIDASPADRTAARGALRRYFSSRPHARTAMLTIKEYVCGDAFLDDFHPGKFSVVLLDADLPKTPGMAVAKRVAATDGACGLIFVTANAAHQLDGYSVHAAAYIMKPLSGSLERLYGALDYCMRKYGLDCAEIEIETSNIPLRLPLHDILYVECCRRTSIFHTRRATLASAGAFFDHAKALLHDRRFLQCYRNLVVNMDFIDRMEDDAFHLKNGENVPISRRKKAEVKRYYTIYFAEKNGFRIG